MIISSCPHCRGIWLKDLTDVCVNGCVIMYEDRPENKGSD